MIPWEIGKQSVWVVIVVGARAPSRLNQGSLRSIKNWCQGALEGQGSLGESSEIFKTRLCEKLYRSHDSESVAFQRNVPKWLYKSATRHAF